MIRLLPLVYLSYLAFATYLPERKDVTVLSHNSQNDGNGNYTFNSETANEINRNETGQLANANPNNEDVSDDGFYTYVDTENNETAYEYNPDENGNSVNETTDYHDMTEEPISFAYPSAVVASIVGK